MITSTLIFALCKLFITVSCSFVIAELAGYWLHRLLHSDKLVFLSRGHLIHHFLIYGPRQPMRSKEGYKDATNNRFSVGNIGLEWLGPSAIVLAICWCVMVLLKVPPSYQIISACSLLIWPIFMFSYLHDRMHVDKYWMTRIPLLRTWFLKSRRLHDIHHRSMNEEGRMDTNFGIGFYFFDRVFGTISLRHRPFNWTGYEIAKERYRYDMCNEGVDEESEAESEAEFPPEINDLPES